MDRRHRGVKCMSIKVGDNEAKPNCFMPPIPILDLVSTFYHLHHHHQPLSATSHLITWPPGWPMVCFLQS